jgi:hypothetical protein
MNNNTPNTQPLTIGTSQGGSPSDVYLFFYLRLCDRFLLDARIAALIAFLPDKTARELIWNTYTAATEKNPDDILSASIHAVGMCIEYFAVVMDLTKVSWAGFA